MIRIMCSDYPQISENYKRLCFDIYATPAERIAAHSLSYMEWAALHGGEVVSVQHEGWAIYFNNDADASLFLLKFA